MKQCNPNTKTLRLPWSNLKLQGNSKIAITTMKVGNEAVTVDAVEEVIAVEGVAISVVTIKKALVEGSNLPNLLPLKSHQRNEKALYVIIRNSNISRLNQKFNIDSGFWGFG